MAGTITKEHVEYVRETFGELVADKLLISNAKTFLDFLIQEGLI